MQIWIILIGFRDMNNSVNFDICKHEFKFTCLQIYLSGFANFAHKGK